MLTFWLTALVIGVVVSTSSRSEVTPSPRLSLAELARREGVALSSAWRWVLKGCRGVRLRTLSIGARRFVEEDAWDEFVTAQTNIANGNQQAPAVPRSTRKRDAAISDAEKELRDLGA
jgi:hypothetical protein